MQGKLGIGLYSLSGAYGPRDIEQVKAMIIKAIDSGVKHFDVAETYGKAEEVLGLVLKNYRDRNYRDQVKISTKLMLNIEDKTNDLNIRNIIRHKCLQSLKNLQTDYIDLYQVHFDNHKIEVDLITNSLDDLKKEGLIGNYGLGHVSIPRLKKYIEYGELSSLMIECSPVALKKYQEVYPICSKNEINLITHGTTGRGLLSGKIDKSQFSDTDVRNQDPLFQRSLFASGVRVYKKLKEVSKKYQKTPVQLAIAWTASLPGIGTVLTGPSTIEHLEENLEGATWNPDESLIEELNKFLIEEEKCRKRNRLNDMEQILHQPLFKTRQKIYSDLIYVIEGLIELNIVNEREVLPLYKDLTEWKKNKNLSFSKVEEIKNTLKRFFSENQ